MTCSQIFYEEGKQHQPQFQQARGSCSAGSTSSRQRNKMSEDDDDLDKDLLGKQVTSEPGIFPSLQFFAGHRAAEP